MVILAAWNMNLLAKRGWRCRIQGFVGRFEGSADTKFAR
jgi:hypothetical protein